MIKNFKSFTNVDKINEAKTLFGDTAAEKISLAKKYAEDKGFHSEKSRAMSKQEIPKEVQDLWDDNIKWEKGTYKLDLLKIWGTLENDETIRDVLKNIINVTIGKEKGWESSGIKMIAGSSTAKKSENLGQTFSNIAQGTLTIQIKKLYDNRYQTNSNKFIIFIYALKDGDSEQKGINKDLQSKIDNVIEGLKREDIISVIDYLKNHYIN